MRDSKKKIPEIRFPGFNDDWEQRKLSSLCENITVGIANSATHAYSDEGIVMFRNQNIKENYLDDSDLIYINDDFEKKYKNKRLKKNDILVARTGYPGTACVVPEKYEGSQTFTTLIARLNEGTNPHYACQYINSEYGKKYFLATQIGGGQKNSGAGILEEFPMMLPPTTEEQERIAEYFSNIDNLITLHQRKCDSIKRLKSSMLQKMFPRKGEKVPEIRFPGFNDAWEQRKLGDVIAELKSGLSRQLDNADIGLPVVRANNINDGKLDMENDVKYWYKDDPQGADTSNYLIHKNDILINFINSEAKMGTATIVDNEPARDTIYTTNILKMKADDTASDSSFLLYLTMTSHYCNYIKSITKPAVNQASFTTVDYKNYSFLISSLEEQKRIGEYFSKLDNLITLHQRKCDVLKELKKGMLQKMFV